MSSRFVPAGTDQDPVSNNNEDWGKARQEVEKQRNAKPVEPGQQEGGKSLYEVLQANKAAKQDAFEEATKVRNQFRALDDSEVEFLDSIRESERVKENVVKKEIGDQLDQFRKQRSAAEQVAIDHDDKAPMPDQQLVKDTWTASKKRRRDKGEETASNKLRKPSNDSQAQIESGKGSVGATSTASETRHIEKELADSSVEVGKFEQAEGKPVGLGLIAYDSDDDD